MTKRKLNEGEKELQVFMQKDRIIHDLALKKERFLYGKIYQQN